METKENTSVVAAIDLDDSARLVLATAARLAGPGGRISLLHVAAGAKQVRRDAESVVNAIDGDERRVRDFLARELGDASDPMWGRIDAQIGAGSPAEQIIQLATDVEADFIVVGTRDRTGLERLALGSVSSEVSRRAHCSVVVARRSDYEGRAKAVTIDAPLAQGQVAMSHAPAPPLRHQRRRFALFDASVIPTGIPRREVR